MEIPQNGVNQLIRQRSGNSNYYTVSKFFEFFNVISAGLGHMCKLIRQEAKYSFAIFPAAPINLQIGSFNQNANRNALRPADSSSTAVGSSYTREMHGSSAIVFILCGIATVENYPNKEYNCPEFDRNICVEASSYENQDIYECSFDYNCDHGQKCCNHCRYGYKVCTQIVFNYKHLRNKYCPKLQLCATPLKYDSKYYCSSDEVCPYGSKCCKNSCYMHKVCVTPFDSKGNEIIPPPTTLRFLRTSLMDAFRCFGSGHTDDSDDVNKITVQTIPPSESRATSRRVTKSTSWPFVGTITKFQRPIESSGSGDGFSDDDGGGDDDDSGSGSGDEVVVQTEPSQAHTSKRTTESKSPPFLTTITQENKFQKTTQRSIEFSGSGDGFSDDDGGGDDDDSGSGSDDEVVVQTEPSQAHISTSKRTTESKYPPFLTTITQKNKFQETTQRSVEFSGSGDGFSDDDDGGADDDSGSGSGDEVLIQTKLSQARTTTSKHTTESKSRSFATAIATENKLHITTRKPVEFSGSGDGDPGDDEDGSASGDHADIIEQQVSSPPYLTRVLTISKSREFTSTEVGLLPVKNTPYSLTATLTDFTFYDEIDAADHHRIIFDKNIAPLLTTEDYSGSSDHEGEARSNVDVMYKNVKMAL